MLQAPSFRPRPYDVIAFDFDGTLADTTGVICATVSATLAALSLAEVGRERLLPLIGLPLAEAFSGLGVVPELVPTCVLRYRELFVCHAPKVCLFPDVRQGLADLESLGIPLAIVSSRGRASLMDLVQRLELQQRFVAVLGEEDVPRKKPAPDLVLHLSQVLGVPTARMLVVGDTTYDLDMAHAAGARSCAVTYGNHDWVRLEASRPHHRVDAFGELLGLVT
jgi:phosphoglycolate phosphatase